MELTAKLDGADTPIALESSLKLVAKSHSLRCDAKQAEPRFLQYDALMESMDHFHLGDFLPSGLVKGSQPHYLESLDAEGIPVISTIVIQDLEIKLDACRYISEDDFSELPDEKKPRKDDVLLTVDGGTSIGKPTLFLLEDDFAIDSHVAILRPIGLDPRYLVYLLKSPIGQLQFNKAESGASGQTAVTEDDIRRFRFPVLADELVDDLVKQTDNKLKGVEKKRRELIAEEGNVWKSFNELILGAAGELLD